MCMGLAVIMMVIILFWWYVYDRYACRCTLYLYVCVTMWHILKVAASKVKARTRSEKLKALKGSSRIGW